MNTAIAPTVYGSNRVLKVDVRLPMGVRLPAGSYEIEIITRAVGAGPAHEYLGLRLNESDTKLENSRWIGALPVYQEPTKTVIRRLDVKGDEQYLQALPFYSDPADGGASVFFTATPIAT